MEFTKWDFRESRETSQYSLLIRIVLIAQNPLLTTLAIPRIYCTESKNTIEKKNLENPLSRSYC